MNGGAIHRMFNEAQPAGIAADKERQYRGKLWRDQRNEDVRQLKRASPIVETVAVPQETD